MSVQSFVETADGTSVHCKDWGAGRPAAFIRSRAAARLVLHATLEIYADAPHALLLSHAERLNRDLLAFARVS